MWRWARAQGLADGGISLSQQPDSEFPQSSAQVWSELLVRMYTEWKKVHTKSLALGTTLWA